MLSKITPQFIQRFRKAVEDKDKHFILAALQPFHEADITHFLYEFDTEESKYVLGLLPPKEAAEIISHLEEDVRKKFLKSFNPKELADLLQFIDSDDIADILQDQPIAYREEAIAYLSRLNREKSEHIKDLLRYDENTAGGLMAKEFIKANLNWNVVQCIEEIRRQKSNVETFYSVYVVDDNDVLQGRVSLKKIILSEDDTLIKDIYESDIVKIESYKKDTEVAALMQKYDLEAVPVVDVQSRLIGRITIDDIVDVITEQAELDKQLMSGLSDNIEENSDVLQLVKAKLPWLIVGVSGGLIGAYFMEFFEKDLLLIPALSFFVPLIMATGGNVGVQSSSLIVQSLANKSLFSEKIGARLLKALIVAFLNGIIISLMVFSYNFAFDSDLRLAFVVSVSLLSVIVLASFTGTITPLLLSKSGINPALASGPFITTSNDLLGLAVYFLVAHLLYF